MANWKGFDIAELSDEELEDWLTLAISLEHEEAERAIVEEQMIREEGSRDGC